MQVFSASDMEMWMLFTLNLLKIMCKSCEYNKLTFINLNKSNTNFWSGK